tara:strand:- start:17836 stop:18885 length:1050 start_codon:yes stop_codon:yes gene_type:complete
MDTNKKITYKSSGVNVDTGNQLIKDISSIVSSTKREGADALLGGFASIFDLSKVKYNDPLIISATDGVGTKLKLAFDYNRHNTIGIDLVAMCVNDIIAQGGDPIFFLDYFATSKLDINITKDVISGIAEGCKLSKCALVGGETAELPGFYKKGHYDLAGFCVGLAERNSLLPKEIHEGDYVFGLKSSGIHSNGFSLVNKLIEYNKIDLLDTIIDNNPLIEAVMQPTKIYFEDIKYINANVSSLLAIAHITGGGMTENLPRVLKDNLAAEINLEKYPKTNIYSWLKKISNLDDSEFLKTFNCGIGMALVIDQNKIEETIECFANLDEGPIEIGRIIKNSKIIYKGGLGYD